MPSGSKTKEIWSDPELAAQRRLRLAQVWTEERKQEVRERMKAYHASKASKSYREGLETRDHGGWRRKQNAKTSTDNK